MKKYSKPHISISEIARRAGKSRQYIWRLVNGKEKNPNNDIVLLVQKLSEGFYPATKMKPSIKEDALRVLTEL